jgi:hypothetical protein
MTEKSLRTEAEEQRKDALKEEKLKALAKLLDREAAEDKHFQISMSALRICMTKVEEADTLEEVKTQTSLALGGRSF